MVIPYEAAVHWIVAPLRFCEAPHVVANAIVLPQSQLNESLVQGRSLRGDRYVRQAPTQTNHLQ